MSGTLSDPGPASTKARRRLTHAGCAGTLALGLWAAVSATSVPTSAAATLPPAFQSVRDYVQDVVRKELAPSIALAVVQGDRVVWAEAFGLADRERKVPATTDTIYQLGSVTKTFTATGVMMLVDRGRIDLDAPANAYLPGVKLRAYVGRADDITIRRMLNHTSGLPEAYNFLYYGAQRPSWDDTIRRFGFAFVAPGSRRVYANHALGFLGYITEVVSGKPWTTFLESELLDRIGMRHTSDRVRPGFAANQAMGYNIDAAGHFLRVPPYISDHPGAGEMRSSAKDLARWMRLHLNAGLLDGVRILKPDTARLMQRLSSEDVPGSGRGSGLGWAVDTFLGQPSFSHAGGAPGVSTQVRAFPDRRIALVVLTNAGAHDVVAEITRRITVALIPDARDPLPATEPPTAVAPPSESVSPGATVGTWDGRLHQVDGDIDLRLVVRADGQVTVSFAGQPPQPLRGVAVNDTQISGLLDALIPSQAGFPGVPELSFQLERDGDRLQGLCKAYAYRQFGLPFWVALKRVQAAQ